MKWECVPAVSVGETGVYEAGEPWYEPEGASSPKISAVWDGSDLLLMGLGQESDREGEVVSWEAASSAPGRVAMNCQKAPFAAIAQKIGREGLHSMPASMRLVHERAVGRDISRSVAPILTSGKPSQSLGTGSPGVLSSPTPEHHEPVRA